MTPALTISSSPIPSSDVFPGALVALRLGLSPAGDAGWTEESSPEGAGDAGHESFRGALVAALPKLRARALKLTRSQALAEDLLQDTFERALRFESSYQPGSNLRAWLHQVLFSVFITRCRRLRRERKALGLLATDPCAWTSLESGPTIAFLPRPVEAALGSLPAPFAEVVRLVDLGEHSYKDAAEQLGIPVGTVMSRLFRGRKLLAELLNPDAVRCAA